MPLGPASRLPKKFRRPLSSESKKVVRRTKRRTQKHVFRDRLRKVHRRTSRLLKIYQHNATLWIAIIVPVSVLLALGVIFFSPLMHVRAIHVTRTDVRLDVEQVQQVLAPVFRKHLLFLTEREVVDLLTRSIRDIESIEVTKQYPAEIHVTIALHPLYASLQIRDPDIPDHLTQTGASIDYLTSEGVYVVSSLTREGDTLSEIILVDWGIRPVPGTKVITPSFLERMEETAKALSEQFGLSITRQTVFLRSQEYHLRVNDTYDLWFDLRGSIDDHLLRYRTFLRSQDVSKIEEYVDLRLSDRVIYK